MSGAEFSARAVQDRPSSHTGLAWHTVRKNLSVVAVSYAIGSLAGFATQSVMARHLGTRTYGVYAAALALVTIAGVAHEMAGPGWLVRIVARDDAPYAGVAGSVLGFRILAGLAVVAVTTVVSAAMGYGRTGVLAVVLLAAIAAFNAALRTLRAGFQVAEQMERNAALATANSVLTAAVMIAVVVAGGGLLAALTASLVVSVALMPLAWRVLPRPLRPQVRLRVAPMRTAARDSLPFTAAAGFAFALSYADTLIVRLVLNTHETGLYGAAWRLITVMQWVPSILVDAVMRGFSSLAAHDRQSFARTLDRSAGGLLVVALPVAAAGSLIAHPVFVFVFGSGFTGGVAAFRILLWSLPLAYPSWVLQEALLVGGRPRQAAWLLGIVATGNILANALVVPRWGITGSAWVMVGSELVALVGSFALLRREHIPMRWPRAIVPAVGVTAATTLAVLPVRHAPLAVPLVTGSAAFLVVTLIVWYLMRESLA